MDPFFTDTREMRERHSQVISVERYPLELDDDDVSLPGPRAS
jgi:hypothetical protein